MSISFFFEKNTFVILKCNNNDTKHIEIEGELFTNEFQQIKWCTPAAHSYFHLEMLYYRRERDQETRICGALATERASTNIEICPMPGICSIPDYFNMMTMCVCTYIDILCVVYSVRFGSL